MDSLVNNSNKTLVDTIIEDASSTGLGFLVLSPSSFSSCLSIYVDLFGILDLQCRSSKH